MMAQENIVLRDGASLPAYRPRCFVPENARFESPSVVEGLFEKLLSQPVATSADFESWLMARSELEAALDQEQSVRYIRMTCRTDHQEYAKAYEDFLQNVLPVVRAYEHKLNQRYLALSVDYPLAVSKIEVFHRHVLADLELFRTENIPLLTRLQVLSQEYQSICGAMTVDFEGQEQTLVAMGRYLHETDRQRREMAWRLVAERRAKEAQRLDALFDRMVVQRNQIAANAGCRNFVDYQFRAYHRFDYTPDDCRVYYQTAMELVLPDPAPAMISRGGAGASLSAP